MAKLLLATNTHKNTIAITITMKNGEKKNDVAKINSDEETVRICQKDAWPHVSMGYALAIA